VKFASTVTFPGLLGIVNLQGLILGPSTHEAPVMVQRENDEFEAEANAVTETREPTFLMQPRGPGQLGRTTPSPKATPVTSMLTGPFARRRVEIMLDVPIMVIVGPQQNKLKEDEASRTTNATRTMATSRLDVTSNLTFI
jgi:hypothetical protein